MKRKEFSRIKHIALIMDGNRRWAKKHKLPVFEGHRRGEERLEPIVDEAIKLRISHLTFWAFSTENWNREKKEVSFLMNLFRNVLDKKVDDFHKKNVKINVIGNLKMFPGDITDRLESWMEKTKNNKKITVNLALSYGGKDEIVRAINKWRENTRSKKQETKITAEELNNYLDTKEQPDPDLLIRTGGEQRLSGFMLWQLEYAELYFTQILWPDFTAEKFHLAVRDYSDRQRRFGR